MEKGKIVELDVARSLSMLYIICFWHLIGYIGLKFEFGEYLKNASLALFMFISSYLLSGKYEINNINDVWLFFRKRVVRIMPLFALSLCCFLIVGGIGTAQSLLSLIGLTAITGGQPATLWFVSMLILFYIVFIIMNRKRMWLVVLLSVIFEFFFIFLHICYDKTDHRLIYYFPCFALGVILKNSSFLSLINTKVIFFFLFVFTSSIMYNLDFSIEIIYYILKVLISISGIFVILYISAILSRIKSFNTLFAKMSYASFCAYLFHRQIYSIAIKLWFPVDIITQFIYLQVVALLILSTGFYIQKIYDRCIWK